MPHETQRIVLYCVVCSTSCGTQLVQSITESITGVTPAAAPCLPLEPTRSCASNRPLKLLERYFTACSVVALALLAAHSQRKRYTTGTGHSAHTARPHSCRTHVRGQPTANAAPQACQDVFCGRSCPVRCAVPAKEVHNVCSAQRASRRSTTHRACSTKH